VVQFFVDPSVMRDLEEPAIFRSGIANVRRRLDGLRLIVSLDKTLLHQSFLLLESDRSVPASTGRFFERQLEISSPLTVCDLALVAMAVSGVVIESLRRDWSAGLGPLVGSNFCGDGVSWGD
jgi:hypothetical protein